MDLYSCLHLFEHLSESRCHLLNTIDVSQFIKVLNGLGMVFEVQSRSEVPTISIDPLPDLALLTSDKVSHGAIHKAGLIG